MPNRNVYLLITVLIIIIVGASSIFLYTNSSKLNTETTSSTAELAIEPNNSWKIYNSDSFTFKYPGEYRIEESDGRIKIMETPIGQASNPTFSYEPYSFYAYLKVENNTNSYTPEEYFINELCYEGKPLDSASSEREAQLRDGCVNIFNESKETLKTPHVEGVLATYNPYEHGHPVFVFTKGKELFAFHLSNTGETGTFPDNNQQELFKQIISTFEFTE